MKVQSLFVLGSGLIAMLALALAGCEKATPKSTTVSATPVGVTWEYVIEVEEQKVVERSDWTLPPDTKALREEQRVHHFEKIPYDIVRINQQEAGGWDPSQGDAPLFKTTDTFSNESAVPEELKASSKFKLYTLLETESEVGKPRIWTIQIFLPRPIKRPWYTYEAFEWKVTDTLKKSGTSTAFELPKLESGSDGKTKRFGKKEIKLSALFRSDNQSEYPISFSDVDLWRRVTSGAPVKIEIGSDGSAILKE